MLSIDATRVLIGVLLLTIGRRLFWLFVGMVGFVGGIRFADHFLRGYTDETVVVFSLAVGFFCAVLAVALRKLALGVTGFVVGGYLLMSLLAVSGQEPQVAYAIGSGGEHLAPWLAFLLGGVIGAVLMNVLFTWTLIVLSALSGGAVICESLRLGPQAVSVVYIVLVTAGILVQSGFVFRTRRPAQ